MRVKHIIQAKKQHSFSCQTKKGHLAKHHRLVKQKTFKPFNITANIMERSTQPWDGDGSAERQSLKRKEIEKLPFKRLLLTAA